jgi:hypothetical protein
MKEINYTLNKNIDYCKRTGTDLFADFKKKNINHLKAVENKRKGKNQNQNLVIMIIKIKDILICIF